MIKSHRIKINYTNIKINPNDFKYLKSKVSFNLISFDYQGISLVLPRN